MDRGINSPIVSKFTLRIFHCKSSGWNGINSICLRHPGEGKDDGGREGARAREREKSKSGMGRCVSKARRRFSYLLPRFPLLAPPSRIDDSSRKPRSARSRGARHDLFSAAFVRHARPSDSPSPSVAPSSLGLCPLRDSLSRSHLPKIVFPPIPFRRPRSTGRAVPSRFPAVGEPASPSPPLFPTLPSPVLPCPLVSPQAIIWRGIHPSIPVLPQSRLMHVAHCTNHWRGGGEGGGRGGGGSPSGESPW